MTTAEENRKFETLMIGGGTLAFTVIGAVAMAISSATGVLASHAQWAAWYPDWAWPLFGAFAGGLTALRFTFNKPRQVVLPAVLGGTVLLALLFYLFSSYFIELKVWLASLSVLGAASFGAISMAVLGAFVSTAGVILTREKRS